MQVREVIILSHPVSGRAVLDAVEKVAGDAYRKQPVRVYKDDTNWVVGQESDYPFKDVAVYARYEWDNGFPIVETLTYSELVVTSYDWKGLNDAFGFYVSGKADAVHAFCEKLKAKLEPPKHEKNFGPRIRGH